MKTFMLLFYFSYLSCNAWGQKLKDTPPTTEEEYNYLRREYKIQIRSDLEMKNNYKFEEFGQVKEDRYEFEFKLLIRDEQNEIAAILVIIKSEVSGSTYYLCIPQNNKELTKRYDRVIDLLDEPISKSYLKVLSRYLSTLSHIEYQYEKATN